MRIQLVFLIYFTSIVNIVCSSTELKNIDLELGAFTITIPEDIKSEETGSCALVSNRKEPVLVKQISIAVDKKILKTTNLNTYMSYKQLKTIDCIEKLPEKDSFDVSFHVYYYLNDKLKYAKSEATISKVED